MSLPIIETPTYELTLPSNGETLIYRPFLVKEEKLLLIGLEGTEKDLLRAFKQVIENVSFGKVNPDELALFDVEYIFLKLRIKSKGEIQLITIPCSECKESNEVTIDFEDIQVKHSENHSKTIVLNETLGVNMKYPGLNSVNAIKNSDSSVTARFDVLVDCIDSIYDQDTVYGSKDFSRTEMMDFLDNLSREDFAKLETFFETMPKVSGEIKFECSKCKKENSRVLQGLQSFLA